MKTEGGNRKIRILVADDHALLRNGVAKVLNQEPDMEVVAEASDGEMAIASYLEVRPDVALVDLRMPRKDGLAVIHELKAQCPDARIIILTTYDTDEDIDLVLKAGAQGYMLKDAEPEELAACIRDVVAGKTRVAPAVATKLAERVRRVNLTTRELAVLRLLVEGKANKEIAEDLHISNGTVKVHLSSVFEKLGVTTRTEAINSAIKRGIVRF